MEKKPNMEEKAAYDFIYMRYLELVKLKRKQKRRLRMRENGGLLFHHFSLR